MPSILQSIRSPTGSIFSLFRSDFHLYVQGHRRPCADDLWGTVDNFVILSMSGMWFTQTGWQPQKKQRPGQVFNVGTGVSTRIDELWKMICALSDFRIDPLFELVRQGDIRESVSDIGNIQRMLGFRPETNLRQGLQTTLAWYRTEK